MDTDVADAAAKAGSRRIDAPFRLLAFRAGGEPALRIFDHHLAHRADRAGSDPRARLPHQRIARIGVGKRIGLTAGAHDAA